MKKIYTFILVCLVAVMTVHSQNLLNCTFTVAANVCVNQEVKVIYTGGASPNAVYLWNFDGATIISGTGPGPYFVKWTTTGEKHITLSITFEGQTCNSTKPVVVMEQPAVFHMTGGGMVVPGTPGVPVGLSGSQAGIVYKLKRNGQYAGIAVTGTGQAISFGPQTVPGNYTALARVDGSDCQREMEGVAVVTANLPPPVQYICMVTFDTASSMNKIIWNKHPGLHILRYNIYKETYMNNQFVKIGEVPYANLSVFPDPGSDPLMKSDKYKISVTDSAGNEGEKSPFHKTIHLYISPGVFGFNLIWNHYEGFEFLTYKIHRKHEAGSWEVIDSIASNVDSYTDPYSASGLTTYFMEVVRPEPCNPSMKSGELMSVLSNTVAAAPLGVKEISQNGVVAYPNPASSLLNLSLPGSTDFQVEVVRPDGVVVYKNTMKGPKAEINVSDYAPGLYILRIQDEKRVTLLKFLKNQ